VEDGLFVGSERGNRMWTAVLTVIPVSHSAHTCVVLDPHL
jgi:hypothetical protein